MLASICDSSVSTNATSRAEPDLRDHDEVETIARGLDDLHEVAIGVWSIESVDADHAHPAAEVDFLQRLITTFARLAAFSSGAPSPRDRCRRHRRRSAAFGIIAGFDAGTNSMLRVSRS